MAGKICVGILGTDRIAARAMVDPARQVAQIAVVAVASRDPTKAAVFANLDTARLSR